MVDAVIKSYYLPYRRMNNLPFGQFTQNQEGVYIFQDSFYPAPILRMTTKREFRNTITILLALNKIIVIGFLYHPIIEQS